MIKATLFDHYARNNTSFAYGIATRARNNTSFAYGIATRARNDTSFSYGIATQARNDTSLFLWNLHSFPAGLTSFLLSLAMILLFSYEITAFRSQRYLFIHYCH